MYANRTVKAASLIRLADVFKRGFHSIACPARGVPCTARTRPPGYSCTPALSSCTRDWDSGRRRWDGAVGFQATIGASPTGGFQAFGYLVHFCCGVADTVAVPVSMTVAVNTSAETAPRSTERCPRPGERSTAHGPWGRHCVCAIRVRPTSRASNAACVARDTSSATRARDGLHAVRGGVAVR
jgi:hypothetical protein